MTVTRSGLRPARSRPFPMGSITLDTEARAREFSMKVRFVVGGRRSSAPAGHRRVPTIAGWDGRLVRAAPLARNTPGLPRDGLLQLGYCPGAVGRPAAQASASSRRVSASSWQHLRLADNGHEIRVTAPTGHQVLMQVRGDAGARRRAGVDPDVEPVRGADRTDHP